MTAWQLQSNGSGTSPDSVDFSSHGQQGADIPQTNQSDDQLGLGEPRTAPGVTMGFSR